jgi:flagellar L-ring protein FlgH
MNRARFTNVVLAALLACSSVALEACGPNHVAPFTPRHRVYKPGSYAQETESARPANGSLFSAAHGGWLEDTRAVRVGDFVVINIDEQANAKGNASTNMSKAADGTSGATALIGLVPALQKAYPEMDTSKLIEFASKSSFAGAGDTGRSGELSGKIAVRVVSEMPNGDLLLEGTKVVLINNEEYHLYVSGLVRPADIAQDNSIPSSRIADAEVEFTGRGDLADQQRKGWGARLIDTLNPF